jgi:hypothetical protein
VVLSAVLDATAFELRGVTVTDRLTKNSATDTVPTIVHLEGAAPGWFGVVGVPILLGRDVSLTDTAATDYPVVIGSDLARRLWGSTNPVGRKLPSPGLRDLHQDSLMMTVVGVYDATQRLPGMTWNGGVARGDAPIRVYTARGKHWEHERILVRTRGPAAPFVTELRKFLRAKAPALPVKSVMTLAQVNEHEYESAIHDAGLVGVVALLLLVRSRRTAVPPSSGAIGLVCALVVAAMMAYTALLGGRIRHTEVRPGATPADAAVIEPRAAGRPPEP